MKKLAKGGILYLLSCFISSNTIRAQDVFIKFTEPDSDEYGRVFSPILEDSILDQLAVQDLSFPEWTTFFSIKTSGSTRSVLGDYNLSDDRVAFTPRFLPDPDIKYFVAFDFNALYRQISIEKKMIGADSILTESISFESISKKAPEVVDIYPSVNILPENTLKIYLYFSQPMGFSNPYDHIVLLDAKGTEVQNAFVELPEGLWNENRTRLTILFHPGRVKQGVGPNLKEGAIFREDELFELVISEAWKDGNGNSLDQDFTKKFFVTKAQRNKLKAKNWKFDISCEKECLVSLSADGIIDIEMIDQMVSLFNANEEEQVDFEIYPETDGTFLLRSDDFKIGNSYDLKINPRLEDICGNTFLNAFDYEEGTRIKEGKPIIIPVEIK